MPDPRQPSAYLIPLTGPDIAAIEMPGTDGSLTLGRHEECQIKLPPDADKVSRFHARFDAVGGNWRVADLNSRWGTFLNGMKLPANTDMPVHEGDLLRITPWTFSFRTTPPAHRGLQSQNDLNISQTLVRSVRVDQARPLGEDLMSLLLESAAGIHAAGDEAGLATLLIDIATRGTGLTNAAYIKSLDSAGRIEIIASRQPAGVTSPMTFSRSLLITASHGEVAELSVNESDNVSQSIVQMKIDTAICVPLILGARSVGKQADDGTEADITVAAYLYLDSRGGGLAAQRMLRPNASAFCLALGRMAGLALANIKRLEMEKRSALLDLDLKAGAEAQRWIFPQRSGSFGSFSYLGESRPGRFVGGDFFDVIPLPDDRIAVALGDVSGKGIPASVLMTATQGFLHAALAEHGDVARALNALNRFINPRRPENKFVTMWVGVFDGRAKSLTYIDAGHGYGLMRTPTGAMRALDAGGGLPIGVIEEAIYEAVSVELEAGCQAVIVSDGIVEQFGMVMTNSGNLVRDQFEIAGVERSLRDTTADPIQSIFTSLFAHAKTQDLSDDATVLIVRW